MNSRKDSDPYGRRDRKGKWVRKGVGKFKVAVCLAILSVFFYCPPTSWSKDQGSIEIDQEVVGWFKDGTCKRVEILEGVRNHTVSCSFTDKNTLLEWNETYPEKLKREVEIWKEKAGEPTAILKRVCRNNGITDGDCPKILYAMAEHESFFGEVMSGDGGRSHGYFHIMDYHKVPKSCSEDLECSADWSLKRMIVNGFKKNRDNAIRLHNGGLDNPVTFTYLRDVKQKMSLWSERS